MQENASRAARKSRAIALPVLKHPSADLQKFSIRREAHRRA
jgi:hypothetical protein